MTGDGWIDHDGFGMPVEPETRVQVRLRSAYVSMGLHPAAAWKSGRRDCWAHVGDINDIVAYRVAPESETQTAAQERSTSLGSGCEAEGRVERRSAAAKYRGAGVSASGAREGEL